MDIKKIKEIIELMNREGLAEVELEEEGKRIKLRKKEEQIIRETQPIPVQVQPQEQVKDAARIEEDSCYIKSPMVGTFYRTPTPDAAPYTDTNKKVEVGDTVCIVEAMKLMNEIKSEYKGKVVEVLVENGDPVDFGQPLFRIIPE
ncbi:MAG: acetyl-CoA carboxylase biotin carboxyl carrier protein [Candidatus Kaelpia aquatica]|nr:acetyl-CoA carboxylase biotin carboxyl carrier protein [Candidatus Kaelpia aquatica]